MCIEKTPWEQVIDFHGHTCPGIALGYRVAIIAQKELGLRPTPDSELLIKASTRSCALDAFQIINKATIGRRALMIEETHEHIYHFYFTGTQALLKITLNPSLIDQLALIKQLKLNPRERQNKNLETIQQILSLEEKDFCMIEHESGVIEKIE